MRQNAADQVFIRHFECLDVGLFKQFHVTRGNTLAGFNDHLASDHEVEVQGFATQTLRHQFQLHAVFIGDVEGIDVEENVEHFFVVVTQCAQQDRDRQFAATIDTGIDAIFRVEFEIQPRTAIRNDASRVQQFARAMGLATVVIEEHARRTM